MLRVLLGWSLLLSFFIIGCEGDGFGCSKTESPVSKEKFELQLGALGETHFENNLPKTEATHVLETDESIEFLSDSGAAVIRHHDDRDIQEGDIVVANEDQGYLLKVKEIIELSANETEVIFQQARVADIIGEENGSFSFETTPIFSQGGDLEGREEMTLDLDSSGKLLIEDLELFKIAVNQEGRVVRRRSNIMGQTRPNFRRQGIHFSANAEGHYSATINSAEIQIIPTIRSNSDWIRGKLEESHTRLDTLVKYRIDISFETSGALSFNALIKNFLPKKKISIRVPGAVPVYLDIELEIPAGISLNSENQGTTRIVYEADYEFYSMMLYSRGRDIQVDKNQNVRVLNQKLISQEDNNKVNAELFLQPKVTTRLYRVLGPYAYLRPYVKGDLDWPSEHLKDELFVGVTGGVGLEVSEPILTSQILNYDSGKIFEFQKSFDIDGRGKKPSQIANIPYDAREKIQVNQLTDEGFVVLDLKTGAQGSESLRFEITEFSKNHLLVASENFYYDGKLYFYPLSGENLDHFSYRVITPSGASKTLSVELDIEETVLDEVTKERFGLTTNSYQVASLGSRSFADKVPNINVGLGSSVVASTLCSELKHQNESYDSLNPFAGLIYENCIENEDDQNGIQFARSHDLYKQSIWKRFNELQSRKSYSQESAIIELQNEVFTTKLLSNNKVSVENQLRHSSFQSHLNLTSCHPNLEFTALESSERPRIQVYLDDCENSYDIPLTLIADSEGGNLRSEDKMNLFHLDYRSFHYWNSRNTYQDFFEDSNFAAEICVYFPFDHKENRVLFTSICPTRASILSSEEFKKDELPRWLLPQFKIRVSEKTKYDEREQKVIVPQIEIIPLNWSSLRPYHTNLESPLEDNDFL